MIYQEFCKEFKERVLKNKTWGIKEAGYRFYPNGLMAQGDPKLLEFIRNTNAKYHGIESDILCGDYVVLRVDMGCDEIAESRYAMRDLYERYQSCGWQEIFNILDGHFATVKKFRRDVFSAPFESYEAAKERLMIRPINYTDNKFLLKNHIYKLYGDIALVVYLVFYDDERGLGGTKLPKQLLTKWNKSCEEVYWTGFENTVKKALPRVYENPCADYENPNIGDFMSEDSRIKSLNTFLAPMVTTTKKMNGAIAMFYPGVKEKLAELIGGSFYAVFTSIHEARIHRVDSMPLENVLHTLQEINEQFPKEELLSRRVFLYDKDKKTFEMIKE